MAIIISDLMLTGLIVAGIFIFWLVVIFYPTFKTSNGREVTPSLVLPRYAVFDRKIGGLAEPDVFEPITSDFGFLKLKTAGGFVERRPISRWTFRPQDTFQIARGTERPIYEIVYEEDLGAEAGKIHLMNLEELRQKCLEVTYENNKLIAENTVLTQKKDWIEKEMEQEKANRETIVDVAVERGEKLAKAGKPITKKTQT